MVWWLRNKVFDWVKIDCFDDDGGYIVEMLHYDLKRGEKSILIGESIEILVHSVHFS